MAAVQYAGAGVAEVSTISPPLRASVRSPWLRGVVWDGFWMQSALWLVPVALWLA